MSNISKNIKKQVDILSKRDQLTLLQNALKISYKNQNEIIENTYGEYTPGKVIIHLRMVISTLKKLCAKNGYLLEKYYPHNRAEEILGILQPLVNQFEQITPSANEETIRSSVLTTIRTIEQLKNVLGPNIEMNDSTKDIADVSKEIAIIQTKTNELKKTTKNITSLLSNIKRHHTNSSANTKLILEISKKAKTTLEDIKLQSSQTKELYKNIKNTYELFEKEQKTLKKKISTQEEYVAKKTYSIDSVVQELTELHSKLKKTYETMEEQSKQFAISSSSIQHQTSKADSLLNQARHTMYMSRGSGLLGTYRELYLRASRSSYRLPWILGAIVGFIFSAILIGITYTNIQNTNYNFSTIINTPNTMLEILLIPFTIFVFFFCVYRWRKRIMLIDKYQSRAVAIETYIRVSDKLPMDSPEQEKAAHTIMRHIEEDFGIFSHRTIIPWYNEVV